MKLLLATLLLHPLSSFAADPALEGTWLQSCGNGVQKTEIIAEQYAKLTEKYFTEKECLRPGFSLQSIGPIFTGGPSTEVEGASLIDFTFERVLLTLHSEELARSARERSLCGLTQWQAEAPVEITGLSCDLFGIGAAVRIPRAGQQVYGIYQVEVASLPAVDRLHFGKLTRERNGRSESTRPSSLDPRFYLRSQ
ncbi:MAG: hypothetical protein NDJ89_09815 [Oligoflexia bacterium]|nr:hypothetical protein [Oligoflexia bacterium]